MKRCTRCVLTENHTDIWFNAEGVCNYCLEFDATGCQELSTAERENEFSRILETHRGQADYDCLMMLSGGKDSTYALYHLVKHNNLRVLAFTFDHGLESEAAMENVRRAVDVLEVDHLYFKAAHLKRLFHFLLKNRVKPYAFCPLCKNTMNTTAWQIAQKFGIRLVVLGNTSGQQSPKPLYPDMYPLFRQIATLLARHKEFGPYVSTYFNWSLLKGEIVEKDGIRFVSPYHHIKWDGRQARSILEKEIGWEAPALGYPRGATNCLMNLVIVYASRREYGYSFYDTEMSSLIRAGEMPRDEALAALDVEIDAQVVDSVLSRIDLSLDDLAFT